MTASDINEKKPAFMETPFAENGDRNNIAETSDDSIVPSFEYGFPEGFSNPTANGGRSVPRGDMNGILHALSTMNFFFQYMGVNPWNHDIGDEGYPKNAKVWYGGTEYVSKIDDNTSIPGTDGQKWEVLPTTATYDATWALSTLADLEQKLNDFIYGG